MTIPLKYAAGDLLYMLPQESALSLSFDLGEGLVETGRIRDVLNLKFESLSDALSRLSLLFDSIEEMHMREQMSMKWEKGLPKYITGLPTPPVPPYIARAGDLPLSRVYDYQTRRLQESGIYFYIYCVNYCSDFVPGRSGTNPRFQFLYYRDRPGTKTETIIRTINVKVNPRRRHVCRNMLHRTSFVSSERLA